MSIFLTLAIPFAAKAEGPAKRAACEDIFAPKRQGDHPYRKFKSPLKSPPQIRVTSFGGLTSFHESRTVVYRQVGDTFESERTRFHNIKHDPNAASYLDHLQKFPLTKMVETGYITEAQAKTFQALGSSLDQRQIKFYGVSREATDEELALYPDELRNARLEKIHGKTVARTASLFSVSAQVMDPNGIHLVDLPWEKEEARKGQKLDRTKVKFAWELGRASQDIAGEIDPLLALSAADIFNELIAMGGRIDEAYVMMHSFDKVNTRYYGSEFPGTLYPADWKDPNDSMFLIPLAALIEKFPPSHFSARVKKIINISEGKIGELDAVNLLMQLNNSQWKEWDLAGSVHQDAPIIVTDWSHATMIKLALYLEAFPFKTQEDFHRVLSSLLATPVNVYSPNFKGKYKNASNAQVSGSIYHGVEAVEISNLDPRIAEKDPYAVETLLVNVYSNYVQEIAVYLQKFRGLSKEHAMDEAENLLVKYDVKFGITTGATEVRRQCAKIGPIKVGFVPRARTDEDPIRRAELPYLYNDAHIFIFTAHQVRNLIDEKRDFFIRQNYDLKTGYWQKQHHMAQGTLL